jgi:hypothetical protein
VGGISRYFCELAARLPLREGVRAQVLAPLHRNARVGDASVGAARTPPRRAVPKRAAPKKARPRRARPHRLTTPTPDLRSSDRLPRRPLRRRKRKPPPRSGRLKRSRIRA